MEKIFNKDLYQNFSSSHAPDDFHHIAFKTTNYEAMVSFYKKLFGCEPLYQSNMITFLVAEKDTSYLYQHEKMYCKKNFYHLKIAFLVL